jgi:hypothetical protein
MLVDYFNGWIRALNFSIADQIKNMGAPILIFAGIWYDILPLFFGCLQKNMRLCHKRRKNLRPQILARFILDFIL